MNKIEPNELLVYKDPVSVDLLCKDFVELRPLSVIPPWIDGNAPYTSSTAFVTRAHVPNVGVVVVGKTYPERVEFFRWAVKQLYAPIVFTHCDDRYDLIRELGERKLFKSHGWYHIAGGHAIDYGFVGRWTWGEAL